MSSQAATGWSATQAKAWLLISLGAVLLTSASTVVVKGSHPAQTRVLGQQFTASSSSGTTTGNSGCGNGSGGASGNKDCSNPGHPVTVTGVVLASVAPGANTKLRLSIVNTNNQDLALQSASAAIGTPSKAGCLGSWFTVGGYSGVPAVTLKKNSTTTLDLTFAMLNKPFNQDACKAAAIPLSFSATATG